MSRNQLACSSCGGSRSGQDRFCPSCGAPQTVVAQTDQSSNDGALADNSGIDQQRDRMANQIAHEIASHMPQQGQHQNPQSTYVNVSSPQPTPAQTPAQTINVNIAQPAPTPTYQPMYHAPAQPSSTFVIMTFVLYIFLFPVGALMNLVGLLCGPHRGWHAVMFFFILIPSCILCITIIALFATGTIK